MKFTAERAALKAAIDNVRAAVAEKSTLPILANVLLSTGPDFVRVVATDNTMQASATLDCAVITQGSTTLPCSRLREIVNASPEGAEISVSLNEEGTRADVRAARARFSIGALPANDFPLMIARDRTGPTFELPASAWVEALGRTLFAAEPGANRAALDGLTLDPVRDDCETFVRFVCMHNKGLSWADVPADAHDWPQTIIPHKSAQTIASLLGGCAPDEPVKAFAVGRLFALDFGRRGFITATGSDTIPPYTKIPPFEAPNVLKADAGILEDAIKRALIVASSKLFRRVTFELEAGQLTVTARGEDGNTHAEPMECEFDGMPCRIAFNGSWFLEHLSRIRTENVLLRFSDDVSPALIAPDKPSRSVQVVMPLKL